MRKGREHKKAGLGLRGRHFCHADGAALGRGVCCRQRGAGGAHLGIAQVAAGVFGPEVAGELLRAHAGVAVADVEIAALRAAALHRARALVEQIVKLAGAETWFVLSSTAKYLGALVIGRESTDQLSGPAGLAQASGEMAKLGLVAFLNLVAILSISIFVTLLATWLLLLTHPITLSEALFEVVSAFATCGLTLAVTGTLDPFGLVLVGLMMFWGRLGALTLVLALTQPQSTSIGYPEEQVLIG